MRRLLIAEQWDKFARLVLPPGCSMVQRCEMRRAFYAGAEGMMRCMLTEVSPGEGVTVDVELILKNIHLELQEFAEKVRAGRA